MRTKWLTASLGTLLTGCVAMAPMDMTDAPVDLREPLGSSEGLVIGSILVSIRDINDPPESDSSLIAMAKRAEARGIGTHPSLDSTPSWISGQAKTDTLRFLVRFEERRGVYWGSAEPDPSAKQYSLVAVPLEEKKFVLRLPAGSYRFLSITPQNLGNGLKSALGLAFDVTPARATYIGRLVIAMPVRVRIINGEYPSIVPRHVEDALDDSVELIKRRYPNFTQEVAKSLMFRE
jgi:hypothetical protein